MSLINAMNSATSGLKAQSKALASISSNISNSSTTGFKGTSTSFESFLNKNNTIDEDTGGVRAYNNRNISSQGDIESTTVTTNLAISGEGFFVISDEAVDGDTYYTRDGSFSADKDGNLVNNDGYYLSGWALDDNGNISVSNKGSTDSLETVNVADVKGSPRATSSATIAANLPNDAVTYASATTAGSSVSDLSETQFTSDLEVFDSLGDSSSVTLTWTKVASNLWSVAVSDPALSTDSTTSTGTLTSGDSFMVSFNSDGTIASVGQGTDSDGDGMNDTMSTVTDSSGELDINIGITWTTGAAASTVKLDLGTVGKTDGLSQYSSGNDTPSMVTDSIDQDGYESGTLKSVAIGDDGTVSATFSNGQTKAIYKIPIAVFDNADGLNSVSGSVFSQTVDSGSYQLRAASQDGAASIQASALENSTVELTDELSRMIMTQQAYTAASKVVTTTDEMLDTLMGMKR